MNNKLRLIAELLEIGIDLVELVYHNLPNRKTIIEQKQLFDAHDIPVKIGFAIIAIISRITDLK